MFPLICLFALKCNFIAFPVKSCQVNVFKNDTGWPRCCTYSNNQVFVMLVLPHLITSDNVQEWSYRRDHVTAKPEHRCAESSVIRPPSLILRFQLLSNAAGQHLDYFTVCALTLHRTLCACFLRVTSCYLYGEQTASFPFSVVKLLS